MARPAIIQTSFLGGEISPSMRGQTDTPVYQKGVGLMRNWIPTLQGSVKTRSGSVYAADASNTEGATRITTFPNNQGNDYGVEFGKNHVTVYNRDEENVTIALGSGSVINNLIDNDTFENKSNDKEWNCWKFAIFRNSTFGTYSFDSYDSTLYSENLSAVRNVRGAPSGLGSQDKAGDYVNNYDQGKKRFHSSPVDVNGRYRGCTIQYNREDTSDPHQYVFNTMRVAPNRDRDDWDETADHILTFKFRYECPNDADLPQQSDNISDSEEGSGSQSRKPVPEVELNDDRDRVATTQTGHILVVKVRRGYRDYTSPLSAATLEYEIPIESLDTTYEITTAAFAPEDIPNGDGNDRLMMDWYIKLPDTGNPIASNDSTEVKKALLFGWVSDVVFSEVPVAGTYAQWDSPYDEDDISNLSFVSDAGTEQLFITHQKYEPRVLSIETNGWVFSVISALDDWEEPATGWLVGDYPRTAAIHQGRLWFGGSLNKPNAIWASRSSGYLDFDSDNSQQVSSDPMYFPLSIAGTIRWMLGHKELLIGTSTNEYIGTSEAGVITPTDFSFSRQSNWGSIDQDPVMVGEEVMYIQGPPQRVQAIRDGGTNRNIWVSRDITITADHLFKNGVDELVYVDEPYHQLMSLTTTGMVGNVYSLPNEARAHYRHEPTSAGPSIESAAGAGDPDGSVIWMTTNMNGVNYIELYSESVFTVYQHDSAQSVLLEGDAVVVDGLDRFDGQFVNYSVRRNDGNWEKGESLFVSDGEVTIPAGHTGLASIGASYECEIVLLPTEGTSSYGTSMVDSRRWVDCTMRLVSSTIPTVNDQVHSPQLAGLPDGVDYPVVDMDVPIALDGHNNGVLKLKQNNGMPSEIAAVYGNVRSSTR